ncbi:DNA gyrase modulator, partial [Accumulibacter sp.]
MTTNAQTLLAQAKKTLLTPYGLDVADLTRVFGKIMAHQVDYADLYFQYSRSEAWSLEEGIVKAGSFNIDEGVGVRALSGEKTAFAYSDDISVQALGDAAAAVRAIAAAGQERRVPTLKRRSGHRLYVPQDPLASLDAASKVRLLERLETLARAEDPRVTQVMA